MAETLSKKQQKFSLAAKKKNRLKSVLCTPYKETFPTLDKVSENKVLNKLTNVISPQFQSNRIAIKKELKIGANETIRALERDLLCFVFVDKSIHLLTKHLVQLACVRNCPIAVTNSLQPVTSNLPKLTRVSCIGVLKDCSDALKQVVDYATSVTPRIELPWLDFEQSMYGSMQGEEEIEDTHDQESACALATPEVDDSLNSNIVTVTDSAENWGGVDPEQKDYSHLYVKRSKNETSQKNIDSFGSSFIGFGSDSDSDELEEIETPSGRIKHMPKRKRTKVAEKLNDKKKKAKNKRGGYVSVNIGKMQANPKRKSNKFSK